MHYCNKLEVGIPKTFEEAISGPDAKQWKFAMEDKMKSLQSKDTYSITQIPEGRQSVGVAGYTHLNKVLMVIYVTKLAMQQKVIANTCWPKHTSITDHV